MNWEKIFIIFSGIFIGLIMFGMNVITIIGIYSDVTSNHVTSATIIVPIVVLFLDIFMFLAFMAGSDL